MRTYARKRMNAHTHANRRALTLVYALESVIADLIPGQAGVIKSLGGDVQRLLDVREKLLEVFESLGDLFDNLFGRMGPSKFFLRFLKFH